MNRIEVRLPTFCYPKKNAEHPCECEKRPVELTHKVCLMFWRCVEGEPVAEGQVIAEFESEKKTMELRSPASGVLAERCVEEGGSFTAADPLAYIEVGAHG